MAYTYDYPRPAVTADCMVLASSPEPQVLLIKRKNNPFKGSWALPGGFMDMDETIESCAKRELFEETNLIVDNLQLIGVFSDVDRDPRGRTITMAYLIRVDHPLPVKGGDDATEALWWPINNLPPLAFDHSLIIQKGLLL